MERERIRNQRGHIIAYSALVILLIASIIWLTVSNRRNADLTNQLTNNYNRALSELVGYVDNIETSLHKSLLVSGPAQLASLSNDIFRQSAAAKSSLGQLPVSDIQLDNTAKFLSQVGDYTYVISQNVINGEELSEEDFNNLYSLTTYASQLNTSLEELQSKVFSGEVRLTPVSGVFSETTAFAATDILADMENVEKSFDEYPSLIYDGPFSEHIESRQSAMLKTAPEITMDEALNVAKEFLGDKGNDLVFESDTQNSSLDAYTFIGGADGSSVSVSITKKGGKVLYYLDNREVTAEALNFSDAISRAEEFLKNHGYTSMESSYYDKIANIATINFAYSQNGVTCYSDLLKVKVALDNGEILGFESNGYLMNHSQRNLTTPALTNAEARSRVNPRLNVDSSGMALIPKDSLQEVLCYEFHGTYDNRNYIIYINAQNGREEEILILFESEDGVLTA